MDQHSLSSTLGNATSYLPSTTDLLLAVPRLLLKAGSVAEHLDSVVDKLRSGGSIIAEPTAVNATNATVATTGHGFIQESVAAAASATASDPGKMANIMQTLKHVANLFGYLTSKWAIATCAIAILLNRTHFYASSRVPLSFRKLHIRILLYILPTMLFMYRIQSLLRAMRCQTSPDWSQMQYGAPRRQLDVDFAGEGGFLWRASSALLLGEPLETSCQAVGMLPLRPSAPRARGSLALLWPLFISLGFSQFVESLSCALQGVRPLQEVGMTIFEHSLAFAETEALITKPLGFDLADWLKPVSVYTPDSTLISLRRTTVSRLANVPPEVLLISLISCFSHLTSNILAIVGLRAKFRLFTTTIWGLAYMSVCSWSFMHLTKTGAQLGVARIPSVCLVGFIPHILIIMVISACGVIYLLAFALTVLSPPPGHPANMSWRDRVSVAYANLHANIHFSAITPLTVGWHEDFYTVILKIGFTILTAASEAVYLNEGTRVNVNSMTWLEKKRLQELLARRRRFQQSLISIPRELTENTMGEGIEVVDSGGNDPPDQTSASGYARERKTKGAAVNPDASRAVGRDNGVGLQQRRGRYILTYELLRGVGRLISVMLAQATIAVLRKLRITYGPRWLRRLAAPGPSEQKQRPASEQVVYSQFSTRRDPWLFNDVAREQPGDLDVEGYARERLRRNGFYEEQGPEEAEQYLNDHLYGWWKKGGNWGDVDKSGDYLPSEDDDATSVISQSTRDEWSDMSDGQRTPTQSRPAYSRESTPVPDTSIDLSRLSHLLDPKTQEDREEARLLSRHLQSQGIMTRSRFRKEVERDELRILTSSRLPIKLPQDNSMSPEEEERILEDFILGRRSAATAGAPTSAQGTSTAGTWDTGADGMGSEGPQCVVCQLSPRTVLVWPCGCLSLCDECRVGLASKNYTTCVCCRTGVVAYSRLYVP